MEKVKSIEVEYEDGHVEIYVGSGSINVVRTYIPAEDKIVSHGTPVTYVNVTLVPGSIESDDH